MKSILLVILLSIIIVSCNKDNEFDISERLPKISEYSPITMLGPSPIYLDTNKVSLQYTDENKISQRVGAIIPTAMGYRLEKDYGDVITYYQDSIIIELKFLGANEDDNMLHTQPKRKLIMHNGYIKKVIYYRDFYIANSDDTLLYRYNGKNQIDEITQIQSYSYRKIFKFKYDDNDNLDIVSMIRYRTGEPVNLDTMWFSDYDNSPNLTKDLVIFPECFYRSLSKNNFRKYVHKSYRLRDSLLTLIEERSWEFLYDENNYVVY